jgi:enoyl-CoA hydratase/carnithine racemase
MLTFACLQAVKSYVAQLQAFLNEMEAGKPKIAALNGATLGAQPARTPSNQIASCATALFLWPLCVVLVRVRRLVSGGGAEFALACHYRVATSAAQLGFPEVKLGLLPGGGGTNRLPKLIGLQNALPMLLQGGNKRAPAAKKMGLIDHTCEEGQLDACAVTSHSPHPCACSALIRLLISFFT